MSEPGEAEPSERPLVLEDALLDGTLTLARDVRSLKEELSVLETTLRKALDAVDLAASLAVVQAALDVADVPRALEVAKAELVVVANWVEYAHSGAMQDGLLAALRSRTGHALSRLVAASSLAHRGAYGWDDAHKLLLRVLHTLSAVSLAVGRLSTAVRQAELEAELEASGAERLEKVWRAASMAAARAGSAARTVEWLSTRSERISGRDSAVSNAWKAVHAFHEEHGTWEDSPSLAHAA